MKKLLIILLVAALVIGAAVTIVLNTAGGQDALFRQAIKANFGQPPEAVEGLRVVVCGSASPLGNDPSRAQACIAVLTPEHFFLFDIGARAPQRLAQARLPLSRLNGVFLTHFHSDHIAGIPDVNLASWVQGRKDPLRIYGGAGVDRVVNGFNMAYSLDRGYRTAHHGEGLLPAAAGPMDPVKIRPAGVVWEDAELTVTAFPVVHPPIEPAIGYRVDYQGRSVVISGDTNAAETLFTASKDADLLFHDALSRTLLDPMIETTQSLNVPVLPRIMTDVIDYHADVTTLPERSAAAGVRQLVLYHMVPVPVNSLAEDMFLRDLPDDIIIAKDLHTFDLPSGSTEILVRAP